MSRTPTLGELFEGLVDARHLATHRGRRVSGVFDDSRRVEPGGIFVAVRGTRVDGRRFAEDALRRGAAVLVGEWPSGDGVPPSSGGGEGSTADGCAGPADPLHPALVIDVPDARAVLARLASRWHGLERAQAEGFQLAGVTGTNGKSTTAFMTRAILRAAGRRCGLLGTVQYDLCARCLSADQTTPGPIELAGFLRSCIDAGASCAVMEVSSHALAQRRTDGVRFDAAAFTNLTGDHLDFHGTMEAYAAAKARLFESLDPQATAVINADDPASAAMTRNCRARVVRYSLRGEAEISARITRESIKGTHYVLSIDGRALGLENALVGAHNVCNALAAAGLAWAIGAPPEAIADGLASVRTVPGRLQRVPCCGGFDVFVDYAHTDDALRNVLSVLRGLTRGRLIVVFGCGGDRDRTKRPRMGRVAAELADAVIVTSDNPRSEEPRAIIDEILSGIDGADRRRVLIEPDRRSAIGAALAAARAGDVVLIAGKGHEDYQLIGSRRIHFDDVEAAIEALARLSPRAAVGDGRASTEAPVVTAAAGLTEGPTR